MILEKINKFLLYVNLFALQSYLIRFTIGPYPSNLQEILILVQVVAFIVWKAKEKTEVPSLKSAKKHWILITFIFLTTLAGFLGNNFFIGDYLSHLKFIFFGIVLTFLFLETFKTNESRIQGLQWAAYGALAFGIFSAAFNLVGYNLSHDLRLRGPLDSAVALAFYLTPFFLFFFIRFWENRDQSSNLIATLVMGLLILGTRSMGAIAAGFLVLVTYLFKRSSIARKKSNILVLGILLLAIAGTIFYSKILPTLNTNYSSLDERGEIWTVAKYALKEPKNALFGIGLGQFDYYFFENSTEVLNRPPLDYSPLHPHNIFLLFLLNYGILGLIFILYIIYLALKRIIKVRLDPEKPLTSRSLATFLFLYFLIHGFIDSPFFKNDMMILFLVFLEMAFGKSLAHSEINQPSSPTPSPSSKTPDQSLL